MSLRAFAMAQSVNLLACFTQCLLSFYPPAFVYPQNSSNGRMVRASASGAVHWGLIPSRVKPMTIKLVFIASLLDVQH